MKVIKNKSSKQKERPQRTRSATGSFSTGRQLSDSRKLDVRQERKKERAEQKRQAVRKKLAAAMKRTFLVGTLALVVLLLLSLQFTQGVTVSIDTDDQELTQALQTTAETELRSRPLNRIKFLINREDFVRALIENHPEVGEVQVSTPLLSNRVQVDVSQRDPWIVWASAGKQYLVDRAGVLYTEINPELDRLDYEELLSITDESNLEPSPGDIVVSSGTSEFIQEFLLRLNKKGYEVDMIAVTEVPREVDVRLTGTGYSVKLSLDRDIGEQVKELDLLLQYIETENIKVNDYIDLRIADRAYYQ